MRMLMIAKMETLQFNTAVRNGNANKIMNRIMEECRPEAAYFTDEEGCRTAILVVNVEDQSQIPRLAEPWFLNFNASIQFKIAMTPEDLKRAGLEDLARKWS
jgi:hypothetical protein